MDLIPDWKIVLKKAWSIRLMLLAGVLSAIEVVLPVFMFDMPRGVFAALSGVVVMSAFVSRLLAQRDLP